MRVLFLNSVCGAGSTGRLCGELAEELEKQGHEVRIAYGRDGHVPERFRSYAVRIGNDFDVKGHALLTRLTDRHGLGSVRATKRFLRWATEYDPQLLWLHNLHGYYLNYELLFRWIKKRPTMQVKWTLHDCWAFTGHCAYFTAAGCEKWKTGCGTCILKWAYPKSFLLDRSKKNYTQKRESFTDMPNLTLLVPSEWLKRLARQSFLSGYPIEVVPNTVDRTVFRPTESDFRERHGLEGKKILLGVANIWEERKGLKDFLALSERLPAEYRIVLVGLSKKQQKHLPEKVLGLPHTDRPEELAEIYTAADVYLNLSVEETFGMTGLEAASCGTKTICYKGTACEEVAMQYGGLAVERDMDALARAVVPLAGEESGR